MKQIRVVIKKISGIVGLHFAGKGGGEVSSHCGHWTRSYFGELPKVGEFISFEGEFPSIITQVRLVPAEWQENYNELPTMIDPETAWCVCRESLGPQHHELVHFPEKWENGIMVGVGAEVP